LWLLLLLLVVVELLLLLLLIVVLLVLVLLLLVLVAKVLLPQGEPEFGGTVGGHTVVLEGGPPRGCALGKAWAGVPAPALAPAPAGGRRAQGACLTLHLLTWHLLTWHLLHGERQRGRSGVGYTTGARGGWGSARERTASRYEGWEGAPGLGLCFSAVPELVARLCAGLSCRGSGRDSGQ